MQSLETWNSKDGSGKSRRDTETGVGGLGLCSWGSLYFPDSSFCLGFGNRVINNGFVGGTREIPLYLLINELTVAFVCSTCECCKCVITFKAHPM